MQQRLSGAFGRQRLTCHNYAERDTGWRLGPWQPRGAAAPRPRAVRAPAQQPLSPDAVVESPVPPEPAVDRGGNTAEPQVAPDPSTPISTATNTSPHPTTRTPRVYNFQWPVQRPVLERPPFQGKYPPRNGNFNLNSILGRKDTHGGKLYVTPRQYPRFLTEYALALEDGYRMFLTEVYGTRPFRYFLELDFDWALELSVVQAVFASLFSVIGATVAETYDLQAPPRTLVSMRTPYKVHLNYPDVITTELQAMQCRERIVQRARDELQQYADLLDWEKALDFPHGSFRLLGSLKTTALSQSDPPWVGDKAYYPVTFVNGSGWVPADITLDRVQQSSIVPTPEQLTAFEQSPAYLQMIYQDISAFEEKTRAKGERRAAELEQQQAALAALERQLVESGVEDSSVEQQNQTQPCPDSLGRGAAEDGEGTAQASVNSAAPSGPRVKPGPKPDASKRQQQQLLEMIAKRAGPAGEAYLAAEQKHAAMRAAQSVMQSRAALMAREFELRAAQGGEVTAEEAAALEQLRREALEAQRANCLQAGVAADARRALLAAVPSLGLQLPAGALEALQPPDTLRVGRSNPKRERKAAEWQARKQRQAAES